jgi:integrase
LKETTAVKYETNLRVHILPTFGKYSINKIKSIDVNEWVAGQIKSGLTVSSVKYNHAVLRIILNEALHSELIESNPCAFTKMPRNNAKPPFILTIPEARAIMEEMPPRYYSFVGVLAFCGLRLGEAIGLKVKHVDLEGGQLKVEDTITQAGTKTIFGVTKTYQNRYVSIPSFLIEALREHIDDFTDGEDDSYLFTSEGGVFISGHNFRHRSWARTCEKLVATGQLREIPLIKDLRASCASWVADSSGILEAAKRLGHSSTSTTVKHYARAIEGKDTQVARELDLSFTNNSDYDVDISEEIVYSPKSA